MRPAAVFAVAGSFLYLVVIWFAMPWVVGDTAFVLDGSNAFLTCLSNHELSGCGYTGEVNDAGLMTPVGDWPLLQHVPDLVAIGLGADRHATRSRMFEVLGIIAVVASVLAAWLAFTHARRREWFWAFMLVLLSSPLLWYARTTFGEPLAAGLVVCFVAATLIPAPPVAVALATIAAAWTKETTYPFLIALGLAGLLVARRRTGVSIRPQAIAGAVGLIVAFAAASFFNVVRYGKVISPNFFEEELHTPGVARKLEYAAAAFVSPSGGILLFWPAAAVVVLGACVVAFRRRRELDVTPAAILVLVSAGLALGFASWWTPFGWAAYGNRLAVPWGLPLALLALVAYGDSLRAFAGRVLSRWWSVALVFGVLLALTLPSVGTMWRPNETGAFFAQEQCDAPFRAGIEQWQDCQHRRMWLDRPMPLYGLRGVNSAGGIATAAFVALGLLGCLVLLRGELGSPRSSRFSSP